MIPHPKTDSRKSIIFHEKITLKFTVDAPNIHPMPTATAVLYNLPDTLIKVKQFLKTAPLYQINLPGLIGFSQLIENTPELAPVFTFLFQKSQEFQEHTL